MERQVVSRVHYCPKCAEVPNHKQRNRRFVVYGSTQEKLHVRTIRNIPKRGFTPHLFYLDEELEEGLLVVSFCCAVEGCGLRIVRRKYDNEIDIMHIETDVFTRKEWKALISFTDTGYEFT